MTNYFTEQLKEEKGKLETHRWLYLLNHSDAWVTWNKDEQLYVVLRLTLRTFKHVGRKLHNPSPPDTEAVDSTK